MTTEPAHPITEPSPPAPVSDPQPVAEHERIAALDVLRGFAIFGIFMVNIAFFSMPLFEAMDTRRLAEAAALDQAAWLVVKALFEIKFITLFSLLFGVGLVVQMNRIEARGADFVPVYLRRIVMLAIIGLVHGFLIWYGDILFMYAIAGLLLILFRSCSPRTLAGAGAIAFLGGGLFYIGGIGLGALDEATKQERAAARATAAESQTHLEDERHGGAVDEPSADAAEENSVEERDAGEAASPAMDDPWERFWDALRESGFNPEHPSWNVAETIAYREGPFAAALLMRAMAYAAHILFAGIFFGFWLRVIAVFLFGAAMMKVGFFSSDRRRWHWALFLMGVFLALPLEVAAALAYPANGWTLGLLPWLGEALHYFSSMALTLGYVGAICLIVHSGLLRWVTGALGCVGRMALTNYIGQSVIATFIMYWWGLALFGEFTRSQQLGLVVAIYAGQIVFSVIWLRFFTMGPLEWLWRAATYGRLPALLRRA